MRKNNHGFTLVELLVTITVGALVTLAATTVILLGLRLNRQSMDTISRQNSVRVLMTVLEKLASENEISRIDVEYDDWTIYTEPADGGEPVKLYTYTAESRVIASQGTPMLENVLSSYLQYEDDLLTISVETEEGIFNSTIYCRTAIAPTGSSGSDETEDMPDDEEIREDVPAITDPALTAREKAARLAFLNTLWSQYQPGGNPGLIIGYEGQEQSPFYSKWYITDNFTKPENWGKNDWNEWTPWCACFVSWGIAEVAGDWTNYDNGDNFRPTFAGVDSFLAYFYAKDDPTTQETIRDYWITSRFWANEASDAAEGSNRKIYPGDVIFLDWVVNEERNPQHVGVVLYYDDTYVYTIEGNVSDGVTGAGVVGLRKYKLDDPRILGYGVLDWVTGELQTP